MNGDAATIPRTADPANSAPHATSDGNASVAEAPASNPATYEKTAHVMSGTTHG